jgi:myo-inositol 2-dehydrogenase/D-chiro-inositol 1-dehydrogenase
MAGSRNNGAGYDVRMELAGTLGTVGVGLDDRTPIRSSEPGSTFAAGQPWPSFWERFTAAYVAEITAFVEVAAGREQSPCTVTDALEAVYAAEAATRSRQQGRAVAVSEVRAR